MIAHPVLYAEHDQQYRPLLVSWVSLFLKSLPQQLQREKLERHSSQISRPSCAVVDWWNSVSCRWPQKPHV
ncbi:hypothetical protein [Adlercreutzia sp. ZJ138]|uniref:hypothetical protein n=1 Tax=Adlercreutzia sp. ZJ138 TaxID=2709405 RepID=UPI0013EC09A5|nr:hypothetical protein [Adlercreutzia sp. ZJ138]